MKTKPQRPATKVREAQPIPLEGPGGKITLRCPFCADHHALSPTIDSPCGTRIEIKAIQEYLPAHTVNHNKIICIKCQKGGGEMVQFKNAFIHLEECNPATNIIHEVPPSSKLAEIVYKLPDKAKIVAENILGKSDRVMEIDETGKPTGNVLSYVFWRSNGKHFTT